MLMQLEARKQFWQSLPFADKFTGVMTVPGKVYRQHKKRNTISVNLNGKQYFIKRHFGTTLQEYIKCGLRGFLPSDNAVIEANAIKMLSVQGVRTTPLVAFGKDKKQSFLVTEALKDMLPLDEYLKTYHMTFRRRAMIVKKLAHIVKTMHDLNLYHRDLYLCHFLFHRKSQNIYLIDLHRALQTKKPSLRWWVKDMGALLFSCLSLPLSMHDVYRFVCEYQGSTLREIENKHQKKWLFAYIYAKRLKKRRLKQ